MPEPETVRTNRSVLCSKKGEPCGDRGRLRRPPPPLLHQPRETDDTKPCFNVKHVQLKPHSPRWQSASNNTRMAQNGALSMSTWTWYQSAHTCRWAYLTALLL